MDTIWLELVIVLLLILGNGFMVGAELTAAAVRSGLWGK
jgi:CBS domain containing-hemolysin-like protein